MNLKPLLWLVPGLLLLGIKYFSASSWHHAPAVPPAKPRLSGSSPVPEKKKRASGEYAPDGSRIIRPPDYDDRYPELMRKAQESARIRDQAFRKVGENSTAEQRASRVDAAMKRRGAQYQTFFESSGIDSQRANQALAIVREREIKLADLTNNYFRNPEGKALVYAANKRRQEQQSQKELANLLGQSEAASLAALEGRMLAEDYARAGIPLPRRDD